MKPPAKPSRFVFNLLTRLVSLLPHQFLSEQATLQRGPSPSTSISLTVIIIHTPVLLTATPFTIYSMKPQKPNRRQEYQKYRESLGVVIQINVDSKKIFLHTIHKGVKCRSAVYFKAAANRGLKDFKNQILELSPNYLVVLSRLENGGVWSGTTRTTPYAGFTLDGTWHSVEGVLRVDQDGNDYAALEATARGNLDIWWYHSLVWTPMPVWRLFRLSCRWRAMSNPFGLPR